MADLIAIPASYTATTRRIAQVYVEQEKKLVAFVVETVNGNGAVIGTDRYAYTTDSTAWGGARQFANGSAKGAKLNAVLTAIQDFAAVL